MTAYSKNIAEQIDSYADLILVGDSLGSVLYNFDSTRKWIYTWYSRAGGSNPYDETYEWVRNETYKFYRGNRFYNVKNDPNERNKLIWANMTKEERNLQNEFVEVLKTYNHLRNKIK